MGRETDRPPMDATGGGGRRRAEEGRIHSRRRQSISESDLPACLPGSTPTPPPPLSASSVGRIVSVRYDDLMYENGRKSMWESVSRRHEIRGNTEQVSTPNREMNEES